VNLPRVNIRPMRSRIRVTIAKAHRDKPIAIEEITKAITQVKAHSPQRGPPPRS
jgi:hypothetical protein